MKPTKSSNNSMAIMTESSAEVRRTSISKAETLEEIAEFWDTHSLADYWEQTLEVESEVKVI